MTAFTATRTNVHDENLHDEDVRNEKSRKRKPENQGSRNDEEQASKDTKDKQRPTELLVWDDLWSNDNDVVTKATETLLTLTHKSNLADAKSTCDLVIEASGHIILLKHIEESLQHHTRHAFMGNALGLLSNTLRFCQYHAEKVSKTPKLVETVFRVIQGYHSSCSGRAIGLLANLSKGNAAFSKEVFEAGAIPLVFESMKYFPSDKHVQLSGALLLRQVLYSNKEQRKGIINAALAAGAISVLSKAKQSFSNDKSINKHANGCLKVLEEERY